MRYARLDDKHDKYLDTLKDEILDISVIKERSEIVTIHGNEYDALEVRLLGYGWNGPVFIAEHIVDNVVKETMIKPSEGGSLNEPH